MVNERTYVGEINYDEGNGSRFPYTISFPDLQECHTQATSRSTLEVRARDVIRIWLRSRRAVERDFIPEARFKHRTEELALSKHYPVTVDFDRL